MKGPVLVLSSQWSSPSAVYSINYSQLGARKGIFHSSCFLLRPKLKETVTGFLLCFPGARGSQEPSGTASRINFSCLHVNFYHAVASQRRRGADKPSALANCKPNLMKTLRSAKKPEKRPERKSSPAEMQLVQVCCCFKLLTALTPTPTLSQSNNNKITGIVLNAWRARRYRRIILAKLAPPIKRLPTRCS